MIRGVVRGVVVRGTVKLGNEAHRRSPSNLLLPHIAFDEGVAAWTATAKGRLPGQVPRIEPRWHAADLAAVPIGPAGIAMAEDVGIGDVIIVVTFVSTE